MVASKELNGLISQKKKEVKINKIKYQNIAQRIINAPTYVSNHTIDSDFKIKFVQEGKRPLHSTCKKISGPCVPCNLIDVWCVQMVP